MTSNHAIIFGASGLIGWALVNELLSSYPDQGTFSKVTAVTNRPLNLSASHWPESNSKRPDLQLVSGIDLRRGDGATLADTLKHAVNDIESVTHVYYLGMSPMQHRIVHKLTYISSILSLCCSRR
jgi:nucleoside-diphosphate-sugar epimerase